MAMLSENVYRSENGDSWRLIRDAASGRMLVRHEANPSSGGHVSDFDSEAFLSRGGPGPEYGAMRAFLQEQTNACLQDEPVHQDPVEDISGVAEGETLVGCFPPGHYRLETGPEGVKLIRRGEVGTVPAVGAGPATPASIDVEDWHRRS